jgi:hypothetical protein
MAAVTFAEVAAVDGQVIRLLTPTPTADFAGGLELTTYLGGGAAGVVYEAVDVDTQEVRGRRGRRRCAGAAGRAA